MAKASAKGPRHPVTRDFSTWLNPDEADVAKLQELLKPLPVDTLTLFPVSPQVNRPSYQGADCIESITAADTSSMA